MTDFKYPNQKDVYWEKWIDAYDNEDIVMAENQYIEDDLEFLDEDDMPLDNFKKPIQSILTPFGVLPITDKTLASSRFKFWVGHANFKLMHRHYPIIENCDGVEYVEIMTPYRFKIAIGKMFEDRSVMFQVKEALISSLSNG